MTHTIRITFGAQMQPQIDVQQGDYNSRTIRALCYNSNGAPMGFDGKTVSVVYEIAETTSDEYPVDVSGNMLTFTMPGLSASAAGAGKLQLRIYGAESLLHSAVIPYTVKASLEPGQGQEDQVPLLVMLVQQAQDAISEANAAADAASKAAASANDAAERANLVAEDVQEKLDSGEFIGPKGDKGAQGVPGTAATITIGSVTESAPGGDASVTNSGTASAAVLDFVIPRGETGPAGATGATGPAGLGVPQPTAEDAGKIPVVNADGSGYELGNPAPEVDDTLSIPGSPADAAATGEAIEAVSPDDESVGAKPWSSKQIIDALCPPLGVTGNPVVCYPVENYPLSVQASWEPRQEGTGDPSPDNVREITGLNEVRVQSCGGNLLDPSRYVQADAAYGITTTMNGDGSFHISGTPTSSITNAAFRIIGYSDALLMRALGCAVIGFGLPSGNLRFDTTTNSIVWDYADLTGGTIDFTLHVMIYYGSTPTAYAPYTGTTATLTLPETIYGGTVDVVTGEGSKEVHGVQFNGTERWTQAAAGSVGLSYFEYVFSDSADLLPSSGGSIALARQSQKITHFKIGNPYNENVDDAGWVYNTEFSTSAVAIIRASRFENVEDWNAYLAAQAAAGTPVTITYKLATHTAFQATGNAPIPALPGTNTVYTDADSLTVTGASDPIATITALQDRVSALESAALN